MSVESKLLVLLPSSTGSLIAICPRENAAADVLTQEVIQTIMGVSDWVGQYSVVLLLSLLLLQGSKEACTPLWEPKWPLGYLAVQTGSDTAMLDVLAAWCFVQCCLV
jgi:hypothetical protein